MYCMFALVCDYIVQLKNKIEAKNKISKISQS